MDEEKGLQHSPSGSHTGEPHLRQQVTPEDKIPENEADQGPGPLTELAFAPVEEQQLEEEQAREQRDEEELRRVEASGEPLEAAIPPPVEQRERQREPGVDRWATLESAESRVTGPPETTESETELSDFATGLYTVCYLIFFAIFGALARIGLTALTEYPGAPVVTGVLWANVGGCLLMGFFAEDRNVFREEWGVKSLQKETPQQTPEEAMKRHKAVKKTIPLYIGLTTGFCGSFTSFSTFMLDVFLALSNDLRNPNTPDIIPRHRGYSFMAVVAVILYMLSLSLVSLIFGAHLAAGLDRLTPTIPFSFLRKILDPTIVFLALGCWTGSIFLALFPPDRHLGIREHWRGDAVFAVVFAPLGCLLRYYVSLWLNPRVPAFPLGTFAVNIFGTMVLGMCFDLQHARNVVGMNRRSGCQVLDGVMDGFCGCTTTVSTWVAELHSLRLRQAYVYGLVSLGTALAVMVVIVGSLRWTVGLDKPVC